MFLLFTLGLEFSLPRMVAMRGEVFGLGALQVGLDDAAAAALANAAGAPPPVAIVIGGAVAMSSTAIVVQQLTEQAEINRTHGRLAFSILLFQDLVFVLFLALATAIVAGGARVRARGRSQLALGKAAVALLLVLGAGRWLVRPLFFEIARHRGQELFTLAVLLVALASAWITHAVGLSLALGAFLAGMLLAETEYRHQVEAVIRPFRDVLLGLFFITIGMLLDLRAARPRVPAGVQRSRSACSCSRRRWSRWSRGATPAAGSSRCAPGSWSAPAASSASRCWRCSSRAAPRPAITQPLLAAVTVSMLLSPLVIRHNKRIARAAAARARPGDDGAGARGGRRRGAGAAAST